MNVTTVEDLRLQVDELDNLLIKGLRIYQELFKNYDEKSSLEDFNLEEYFDTCAFDYEMWHKEVAVALRKLPRNHYLYHFLQPNKTSMMIVGMPIKLSNYKVHLEQQLKSLEDIIVWLEESESLALRKEIAEKEWSADVVYQIRYSSHTREIKLNNILLSKPDFDRENERCFGYIFANPGRPISKAEIEKANGETLKKPIKHILRDLGFVGDVAKVFFTGISEKAVEFVNPITRQYHYKHDLPVLDFTTIGRNREKSGGMGKKSTK